jgi:OOP family OmpA-OmpF porin
MATLAQKTKLGLAASALALSIPTAAIADGTGLMLGGGLYYGTVDERVSDFGDIKLDDSSGAYNLDIGWRFNKWIAVDAGYWGLGEYKSDDSFLGQDIKVNSSAWTVGGIGSIPIWIIDLYARLGAAWYENNVSGFDNDDGTNAYYGLGIAFNIGSSLDIYGEWTRFDVDTDLDLFGLGLRWTF